MPDVGTGITPPTWLQWVRVGTDQPLPGRIVAIHQRELRPIGAGTASEEWALIEYHEAVDEDDGLDPILIGTGE